MTDSLRPIIRQLVQARVKALFQEIEELQAALGEKSPNSAGRRQIATASDSPLQQRRRGNPMSAAQKLAVSRRMKKYWRQRRQAAK